MQVQDETPEELQSNPESLLKLQHQASART
jgi:hypothetical protein